ncbi:hypothetical protein B9479_008292 [Cryptococcus floricola]|uniref:Uncharacterized protein n=1 Tax=Cryptococcus floricola TaxID=2591691 RepID=A0A5D3AMA9_9TREE|nr:hypothetical protein B9479_008292 [Cryptococcus floricola]
MPLTRKRQDGPQVCVIPFGDASQQDPTGATAEDYNITNDSETDSPEGSFVVSDYWRQIHVQAGGHTHLTPLFSTHPEDIDLDGIKQSVAGC